MTQQNKGFSLVELMIAVAIVGILSAIALPSYNSYVEKTNLARAKEHMTNLRQMLASEKLQNPRSYTSYTDMKTFYEGKIGLLPSEVSSKYTFAVSTSEQNSLPIAILIATPKSSGYQYGLWSGADGSVYRCKKADVSSASTTNPSSCEAF